MKKLDLLVGNNPNFLFEESIKHIGIFLNDFSKENIVIVPDRLSLQAPLGLAIYADFEGTRKRKGYELVHCSR